MQKLLNFYKLLCKMEIQMFNSKGVMRVIVPLYLMRLAEMQGVQQKLINDDMGQRGNKMRENQSPYRTQMSLPSP